jgi:aspartate racemase
LCHGRVEDSSREKLLAIIAGHEAAGADGVILGCTELCMILEQAYCDIAVFDTTGLHAAAAMRFVFGDEAS